jgi:hypothetical protein
MSVLLTGIASRTGTFDHTFDLVITISWLANRWHRLTAIRRVAQVLHLLAFLKSLMSAFGTDIIPCATFIPGLSAILYFGAQRIGWRELCLVSGLGHVVTASSESSSLHSWLWPKKETVRV